MKTRFLLSTFALLVAGGILALSLMKAQNAFAENQAATARKQLYFGKEILPDNVLYPVIMAMDRVQLETAPDYERVFIQMEYANRRLEYSEDLLIQKNDDESLIVSTLTKAEAYLQNATQESLKLNSPNSVKESLAKTIEYHISKLKELAPKFTDSNRSLVDHLVEVDTATLTLLK